MLMTAAMLVKIVGGHECRHERGQKFVGMACAGNLDEVARLVMRRSWVHLEEIAEKNAPQVSRPVEGERGVGAAITLLQDSVSKTIIDKNLEDIILPNKSRIGGSVGRLSCRRVSSS